MQPWKTLKRECILDHSKYLKVEDHTVELPNGRIIEHWAWVIMPAFVNIVAIDTAGHFLCFRQYKYSACGETLALPGGYLEPGEEPLIAAQRELLEETGYGSGQWQSLGSYPLDGNRGAGVAHLFLAQNVVMVANRPVSDDLEEQQFILLSRSEVENALRLGDFKELSWMAALALALLHLA